MPPAELTALTEAITTGFANLTAAVTASQSAVDLAPLVDQVQRVADAMSDANDQVASVIGTYSDGERVKVYSEPPSP